MTALVRADERRERASRDGATQVAAAGRRAAKARRTGSHSEPAAAGSAAAPSK